MIEISVVIPNHNRADALPLTLDALAKQNYQASRYEVIVVDQASTDGSVELLINNKKINNLRIIKQDSVEGPSTARNTGSIFAKGKIIIFSDCDLIPDSNFIQLHENAHTSAKYESLICGRMKPYLPAYRTHWERIVNPESGLDRGDTLRQIPFYQAFGGNMSIPKTVSHRIGFFNPRLRSFEDIEFAYRAQLLDIPIIYCPDAISYHNHPRSLIERCEQAQKYQRALPELLNTYPAWRKDFPAINSFLPPDLHEDDIYLLMTKLLYRFYSLNLTRRTFLLMCRLLNRYPVSSNLMRFAYYRLIIGCWQQGFQEGISRL